VILSGDPSQIPPVQGCCLWDKTKSSSVDDTSGFNLHTKEFKHCIILTEVKRVEDPEAGKFLKILDNLQNGENTEEEWCMVCTICLTDSMRQKIYTGFYFFGILGILGKGPPVLNTT
jgi:hypothetical protein